MAVWLEDGRQSIEKISQYTAPFQDYKEVERDRKTVDAVERNVEKIAEALKNVRQMQPDIAISNLASITSFRNQINHVYCEVKYDIVWNVMKEDLPVLEEEIKRILADFEQKLNANEL